MSPPLVTIVVPAFNRAGFVETAVESVLSQDYEALEVIALDDGSTDETGAVLARIAERTDQHRYRWLTHENVGQATTINRGFEAARGELLGYLSSDDALVPGAISRLVEVAEQHPDADVIYPWFQYIDVADRIQDTIECESHSFGHALRSAVCIPGPGAIVRRRLYERIGGWDPSYRSCPDFEWWLRAGEAKFVCVPEPLALFRVHDGSITSALEVEAVYERLRLLDELYARDDLPQEAIDVRKRAYAATLVVSALMLDPEIAGAEDSRFVIEDRNSPRISLKARDATAANRVVLQEMVRHSDRRLRFLASMADEQRAAVSALEETVRVQQATIASLQQLIREPLLVRIGRRITPRSMHPYLSACLQRLRLRAQ